jgi:hypothetical protein
MRKIQSPLNGQCDEITIRQRKMVSDIRQKKENVMSDKREKRNPEEMRCASCGIRRQAEANPTSVMARVWKWHTEQLVHDLERRYKWKIDKKHQHPGARKCYSL